MLEETVNCAINRRDMSMPNGRKRNPGVRPNIMPNVCKEMVREGIMNERSVDGKSTKRKRREMSGTQDTIAKKSNVRETADIKRKGKASWNVIIQGCGRGNEY